MLVPRAVPWHHGKPRRDPPPNVTGAAQRPGHSETTDAGSGRGPRSGSHQLAGSARRLAPPAGRPT
jgi:hypothetical protein